MLAGQGGGLKAGFIKQELLIPNPNFDHCMAVNQCLAGTVTLAGQSGGL
jgi:hypothetical protein